MRQKKFLPTQRYLWFLCLLVSLSLLGDAKEIQGTIQNAFFKDVGIAKIQLKETGRYFYSGKKGAFTIPVPDEYSSATLVFYHNFFFTWSEKVKMDQEIKKIQIHLVAKEHLQETVTVTALSYEEKAVAAPVAESVVSEVEIKEKIAENLVATLQNSPGVHFIGQGGFQAAPSIRGLARRRVLMLVDGARIISDRRVGASGSFIAPELVKRVEVVRSSSAVLYGSDAIGGVFQVFTSPLSSDSAVKNSINLNLDTRNERYSSGLALAGHLGKVQVYSGFQYATAGDYASPGNDIYNSGYSNYCGVFNLSFQDEKREVQIGYLGGIGQDIGKPNRQNDPNKPSTVLDDINHFINLQVVEKALVPNATLSGQFYLNPQEYSLKNQDLAKNSADMAVTTALNYGIKLNLKKSLSPHFSYQFGIDNYSRENLDIDNTVESNGQSVTTYPLTDGQRRDTGLYFMGTYAGWQGFNITAGLRYTFFSLKAAVEGAPMQIKAEAPAAFLGITRQLGHSVSLFLNLGRAYRTPSLSEAFYTGITGRRYVIANPNLKAEKSFNIDGGVKFFSKKVFLGLYLFHNDIRDMIERYMLPNGFYTYDNILSGKIWGGEIEVQVFPIKNLEIFGHYFYYRGRSDADDAPLNDLPAPSLFLGSKLFVDRFWCEINYTRVTDKNDPGPAEVENTAYNLLDFKTGYYFSANLSLYLKASNILDETFYANADPDIPQARGFEVSAGINFYF